MGQLGDGSYRSVGRCCPFSEKRRPGVSSDHTEQVLEVAGTHLQLLKGGSGEALLVLHGAGGNPGWLPYHQELATHFTVYAPSHPGYGQSARLDWITTINDMAHFYRHLIEEL